MIRVLIADDSAFMRKVLSDLFNSQSDFQVVGTAANGQDAIDKVKNGISIFIYPEGTRNKTDKPLGEFHKGSFKIAQKAGCPIVPVVVNHTDEILEKHFPFIKSTKVTIEYCKPVIISELSKEDQKNIDSYVKNIIEETYLKNQ